MARVMNKHVSTINAEWSSNLTTIKWTRVIFQFASPPKALSVAPNGCSVSPFSSDNENAIYQHNGINCDPTQNFGKHIIYHLPSVKLPKRLFQHSGTEQQRRRAFFLRGEIRGVHVCAPFLSLFWKQNLYHNCPKNLQMWSRFFIVRSLSRSWGHRLNGQCQSFTL